MSPWQQSSNESGELSVERAVEAAEPLGEREERPDRLVCLGGVDVHRPRHEVTGERQLHHVRDRVAGLVLRLARRRPEVGRDDDLLELEQRRLGRRLLLEHVERGSGDDTIANALSELRLDNDPAAGDVDHAQRRLRLEQQLAADQARRLLVLRQVDRQEVTRRHDLVERHQLDAHLAGTIGGDERVVGDKAHLERLGAVGDELADAAEADDAERLVGELDTLPARPLPAARRSAPRVPEERCAPGRAAARSCARRRR